MPLCGNKKKGVGVPLTEAQLQQIFKQHDTNGDGNLDYKELKEAFRSLGAYIPVFRAGLALYEVDCNGDKLVNQEEMNHLVRYAANLGYTIK